MLLALIAPAQAQIANNTIKLGVLTDLTGIATDSTGAGSVAAARLAIEDFKAKNPEYASVRMPNEKPAVTKTVKMEKTVAADPAAAVLAAEPAVEA